MDIREIRRSNLELLLTEFGTIAALARKAETDPSYISQIRSKVTKREMGDSLARKLEKAANKWHGWMDHGHGKDVAITTGNKVHRGALTRHEEAIIEIYRQLPPGVRKRFLDIVYAFAATCGVNVKRVA